MCYSLLVGHGHVKGRSVLLVSSASPLFIDIATLVGVVGVGRRTQTRARSLELHERYNAYIFVQVVLSGLLFQLCPLTYAALIFV